MDCVFCKIANGEIPAQKIFEDEKVMAFLDLNPLAPVHFLVIPKTHTMDSADGVCGENSGIIAHIFEIIPRIAKEHGLGDGYRIVTNCGENAQQSVKHIHFHVLGGEKLGEMV